MEKFKNKVANKVGPCMGSWKGWLHADPPLNTPRSAHSARGQHTEMPDRDVPGILPLCSTRHSETAVCPTQQVPLPPGFQLESLQESPRRRSNTQGLAAYLFPYLSTCKVTFLCLHLSRTEVYHFFQDGWHSANQVPVGSGYFFLPCPSDSGCLLNPWSSSTCTLCRILY